MKPRKIAVIGVMFVLILAIVIAVAQRFDLSAIPEPGPKETALANRAKHFVVAHAVRRDVPPPPQVSADSLVEGKTRYGVECATCHGMDGRGQTDYGRWMYPRAADLTSPQVQAYRDAELFWIIKNGVRLTGMPAFGKVESDVQIWHLVRYLRSLPATPAR